MAKAITPKAKPVSKSTAKDASPAAKAGVKGKKIFEQLEKTVSLPAEPIVSAVAPRSPDEGKAFTKEELSQLEVFQLRMTTLQQQVELLQKNLENFVRDANEKIKIAQTEVSNRQADAQKKAEELMAFYGKLEEKYGIKMRDITYDPASGKIMTAPPGLLDSAQKH